VLAASAAGAFLLVQVEIEVVGKLKGSRFLHQLVSGPCLVNNDHVFGKKKMIGNRINLSDYSFLIKEQK
jgi:hypothetical protein